jgi:glycogen operon protein
MNAGEHATAAPISVWRGKPRPLGSSWDGAGVNFALYSENAEAVELCLFDPKGRREIARIDVRERTNFVWHCYLPEARPGQLYGYRVHGPYAPERGDRFNAHKLLLDPYARLVAGPLDRCPLRISRRRTARRPVVRYARQRVGDAQVPGDRLLVHLGQRHTAANPVGTHGHLRIAR